MTKLPMPPGDALAWHARGSNSSFDAVVDDVRDSSPNPYPDSDTNQIDQLHELIGWLDQQQSNRDDVLAAKVHDELAATLTALTMRLALISRHAQRDATDTGSAATQPDAAALVQQCQKASALLTTLMATTRELQQVLRPFAIESLGFDASLTEHLAQFKHRTGIATELQVSGILPAWPAADGLTLLRLVEHALLNVEQHADAHHVRVDIDCAATYTTISIADDGVGIDPDRFDPSKTHGLRLMQARAAQLQGRCDVMNHAGLATSDAVDNALIDDTKITTKNSARHASDATSQCAKVPAKFGGCRILVTLPTAHAS